MYIPSALAPHVDQKQVVVAEPLSPGRRDGERRELALGVDVEDEDPPVGQMRTSAVEHALPVGEADEMVDRVEDAEHHVEGLAQVEAGHVRVAQARTRDLPRGDVEHRLRGVEPGDLVVRLQRFENRTGPAGELEDGCCARAMPSG